TLCFAIYYGNRRAWCKRGVMMNPVEFLKARIAEWEEKRKQASEEADLKAFELAESEIKNYQAMLKTYEQPAT
ncbi:hypothetical protein ACTHRZ_11920, partial [Neisseria sp. P0001.S006]|uniref:hypothetical protein n=3 Tax=Neisseria TaxID=482 RepID=UPI003F814B36